MACQKIFEELAGDGAWHHQDRHDLRHRRLRRLDARAVPRRGGRIRCIEVVADESYGPTDADMTPQLTNIKNTAGIEAVLNPGFGQGPSVVTRNYQQLAVGLPSTRATASPPRAS